jgi:hypothetical protein
VPERRRSVEVQPVTHGLAVRVAPGGPGDRLLCHHPRDPGDRGGRDDFGSLHVFLQEHRRDGQDIADVIEPVAGIVGRQLVFDFEIVAHQVPDGVPIFHAIEPAQGHAPGVGIGRVG